ncbi:MULTISPECIES: hypothetical protein [Bradyrhizobium]|uniref:hypothetical protein n=1 Tax=Bradyrhizobium TaxID=374 RepID=UPI001B8A7213|nr:MULTISPECIES: hypothetical protein [Bradyrhizobium]MBR0974084.1 hypothetical protein [Bradyrhizobium japonicum]
MAQLKPPSGGPSGTAAPAPPQWMHRTTPSAPERRAGMLAHMARARSVPQPQAATVPEPLRKNGKDILGDAFGYMVLFGIIALLVQSRIPLYLGAFLFLTDGARIEAALATIGIRFEPDTIGPDIVKGFVSLFGWFALLASSRNAVPAWLAAWMPPDTSWSTIAGIAVVFAVVEAFAALAMRHALPWFGFRIRSGSLTATAIKLLMAVGLLALLVLLGSL